MAHYKIFNTADNLIGVAVKGEMLSVHAGDGVYGYGNVSEAVDKNPGWRFEKVEETAYNEVAAKFKDLWVGSSAQAGASGNVQPDAATVTVSSTTASATTEHGVSADQAAPTAENVAA